jgi:phosphate/sulfate permease
VPTRLRNWVYAIAAAMVVASGLCWWLVHGVVGQAIAIALITGGLFGAFTFWFVELGWDEERERVSEHDKRREIREKRAADRAAAHRATGRPNRFRRRPG